MSTWIHQALTYRALVRLILQCAYSIWSTHLYYNISISKLSCLHHLYGLLTSRELPKQTLKFVLSATDLIRSKGFPTHACFLKSSLPSPLLYFSAWNDNCCKIKHILCSNTFLSFLGFPLHHCTHFQDSFVPSESRRFPPKILAFPRDLSTDCYTIQFDSKYHKLLNPVYSYAASLLGILHYFFHTLVFDATPLT